MFRGEESGRGRPVKPERRDRPEIPVLKGRLRGYAVGLIQLFREVPCPDLMAGWLLEEATPFDRPLAVTPASGPRCGFLNYRRAVAVYKQNLADEVAETLELVHACRDAACGCLAPLW